MNLLRVGRSLAFECFFLLIAACDSGESGGAEWVAPDAWSRILQVESFQSTLVYRHSYGGCSYVSTYEAIGNGEGCSEGVLRVGLTDPTGDLVDGRLDLCGTLTIETDHDEECHGDDETTMRPLTSIASIELAAPDADAPMTMTWRWGNDLVLESEIDPATALEDAGSSVTVSFVDTQTAYAPTREVSVDAEIVIVAEPEDDGGCGQSPGTPSGETLRCG